MRAAEAKPLEFRVKMYCGQMMVTGRVAPGSWWYDVTRSGRKAELAAQNEKKGRGFSRGGGRAGGGEAYQSDSELVTFESTLFAAQSVDSSLGDELTLVDVRIYPADFIDTTKSGGQTLPIASQGAARLDRPLVDSRR